MRRFTITILAIAASLAASAQTVADFESLSLPKNDTFYVNYTNSGNDVGFSNGLAQFPCIYDTSWGGFWSTGFSYSNMTDSITSGFTNSYSAKTAKGYNGSGKYVVSWGANNYIKLAGAGKGGFVNGFYVTNSTYAYNAMRDGDAFAKKFGGTSGNDANWFKLVIYGYNNGIKKQDSIEFYLADFRNPDNNKDYILKTWQWVNLLPLGKVDSLDINLSSSDVGTWGMNTPAYYCIDNFTTQENIFPYAPQATVTGTTAIATSSTAIKGWATNCTVARGWMDIANTSLGKANLGMDAGGVGVANNDIVSLGDSGVAVLTFNNLIYNGSGPDFVVFENGFVNGSNAEESFMELAFVEVSSDGINYTRFPASCYIDTTQIPVAGVYSNARKVHNLAGKYIVNYGTPFDLQELAGTPGLDIDNISHVRIVDVVGDLGAHASFDKDGRRINDPYPTAIPSSGFDLDAVGVLYLKWPVSVNVIARNMEMQVYPNPTTDVVKLSFANQPVGDVNVIITDITGKQVQHETLSANSAFTVGNLSKGVYYITVNDTKGNKWVQKLSKI